MPLTVIKYKTKYQTLFCSNLETDTSHNEISFYLIQTAVKSSVSIYSKLKYDLVIKKSYRMFKLQ